MTIARITVANGKIDGWLGCYVGRQMFGSRQESLRLGSALGNPFRPRAKTTEEHDRVVSLYREWLWLRMKGDDSEDRAIRQELQRLKVEALNKELVIDCWCKPFPCHGDVIKRCIEWAIANNYDFWDESEAGD